MCNSLVMPIVARQSHRLPPSVLPFFWRGHGWFFDFWPYLLTYTIAQLFVNYIVRSYQRSQSSVFAPTLESTLVVQLLSRARDYYLAPAIISRLPLLSRARHYYLAQCHTNRANNLLIMIITPRVGESAAGGLSHSYPLV